MKYYYNGELIRTSDHIYTHAVIDTKTGKAVACRNGLDKAEAAKLDETRLARSDIRDLNEKIKAIKAGKNKFWVKVGRTGMWCKISEKCTVQDCENSIKRCEDYIRIRNEQLIVVPLTAEN